jgi:hypothetical protein
MNFRDWLNARGEWFGLGLVVTPVLLIVVFVFWLEERTLALVAALAFAGLFAWAIRDLFKTWRDAELSERVVSILGAVLMLGVTLAHTFRFVML